MAGGAAVTHPVRMDATTTRRNLTAEEHARCVQELERLRDALAYDARTSHRSARGLSAEDAAEELVQVQHDAAVTATRIARLEELLRDASVLEDGVGPGVVSLGRRVHVKYLGFGKVAAYRICGGMGAPRAGTLSAESPIGAALLGASPGDVVSVELPRGRLERLRVLEIDDPPEGGSPC